MRINPARSPFLLSLHVILLIASCNRQPGAPHPQESQQASRHEIVIAAVGDIMMPGSVQAAAARNKNDYGILFERIAPELGAADITFANLETTVDHTSKISGYPRFNARPGILASLRKAGVDIVSIANNHIMDGGAGGLIKTIDNIESSGLIFSGAGRTRTEAAEIKHMACNGITVAFLAYTYGTNGRLPKRRADAPAVNILRPGSEKDLSSALGHVRKAGSSADLVAVSLHWGDEYEDHPSAWQERVAFEMIEAGADIILGHHPHVLQPVETVFAKDGRRGIVAYSLGNFISSQNYGVSFKNRDHKRARTGDGIILRIMAVEENGSVRIEKAEFIPIWTMREKTGTITVTRPVSLEREIADLEGIEKRSMEQESMIKLLSYRKKIITDKLTFIPE